MHHQFHRRRLSPAKRRRRREFPASRLRNRPGTNGRATATRPASRTPTTRRRQCARAAAQVRTDTQRNQRRGRREKSGRQTHAAAGANGEFEIAREQVRAPRPHIFLAPSNTRSLAKPKRRMRGGYHDAAGVDVSAQDFHQQLAARRIERGQRLHRAATRDAATTTAAPNPDGGVGLRTDRRRADRSPRASIRRGREWP